MNRIVFSLLVTGFWLLQTISRADPASPVRFTITHVSGDTRCDSGYDCRIEVQGRLSNAGANRTGELIIRCDHLTDAGDPIPASFLDRTAEIIPDGLGPGETRQITFTLSDVDNSRTLRCRVADGIATP